MEETEKEDDDDIITFISSNWTALSLKYVVEPEPQQETVKFTEPILPP